MKRNRSNARRLTALLVAVLTMISMMPVLSFAEEKAKVDEPVLEEDEDEKVKEVNLASSEAEVLVPVARQSSRKNLTKKQELKLQYEDFPDMTDTDISLAVPIMPGDEKAAEFEDDEIITYVFESQETANYIFYATGSVDNVGRVMKMNSEGQYEEVALSDDDGDENNFRVSFSVVAGEKVYLQCKCYSSSAQSFTVYLEKDDFAATISGKYTQSTGKLIVTGDVTGDTFDDLYVDGNETYSNIDGETHFEIELNMRDYDVGYHEIYAVLKNHNNENQYVYYDKAVPTMIYGTPSNKLSYYKTGYKYINLTYGGSMYSDYDCDVYFDLRLGKGKWKGSYGPVRYSTVSKSKLKAGKKYSTRLYYGKKTSYGGKNYFFSGKTLKKISKSVTMKTGGKKLSVKSLKISKAKVKTENVYRGRPGYMWDPYNMRYISVIRYGYAKEKVTTFKITLKLKKKPGAAGVYIGNHKIKGNKKKYTATLKFLGNRKGDKINFELCSYQSSKYYGLSKSVHKKAKVK